jgi:hypothetical protein
VLDRPLLFPLSGLGSLSLDVQPDPAGGAVVLSGILTIGGATWRRFVKLEPIQARDFAMRITRVARVVEGEAAEASK